LLNREDYFIKYVLTAGEKIPYLLQDAGNVMEKIWDSKTGHWEQRSKTLFFS